MDGVNELGVPQREDQASQPFSPYPPPMSYGHQVCPCGLGTDISLLHRRVHEQDNEIRELWMCNDTLNSHNSLLQMRLQAYQDYAKSLEMHLQATSNQLRYSGNLGMPAFAIGDSTPRFDRRSSTSSHNVFFYNIRTENNRKKKARELEACKQETLKRDSVAESLAISFTSTENSCRDISVMAAGSSCPASLLNACTPDFCPAQVHLANEMTPNAADATPPSGTAKTSRIDVEEVTTKMTQMRSPDEDSKDATDEDQSDTEEAPCIFKTISNATTPEEHRTMPDDTEALRESSKSCPPTLVKWPDFDSLDDETNRLLRDSYLGRRDPPNGAHDDKALLHGPDKRRSVSYQSDFTKTLSCWKC